MSERQEQAALFEWAEWQGNNTPELKLLFAIPNGQVRPGQPVEPGLKPGVPDVMLPVMRGRYAGFFGELKVDKNGASDEQKEWLAALSQQGYYCTVQWGFEAMKDAILDYLALGEGGYSFRLRPEVIAALNVACE